jgi:AraC family transcriptional activator of tynA and feaB
VGAVCEGFLEMAVRSRAPQRFDATLTSSSMGELQLNRVEGSAQDVYRTAQQLARGGPNYFYLLCKVDEPWAAAQEERRTRLAPGDCLLVDSRRRYEFHFPTRCDTVSLQLTTAWVERWLPDPAAACGRALDGRGGFGAALSAFARQLQPELALAPPLPPALLADQLGALLALAAGTEAPVPRRQVAERIASAVRERHAEPGLTAAAVAAGLGIGERTLHRALAAGGHTFAQQLMACRIDAARHLLADRRFDCLTVGEIGRRVGLLDPSHFVRAFRRATGRTPGALRTQR